MCRNERVLGCLDIQPEHGIEVLFGTKPTGEVVMWVNIDGICRLRSTIPTRDSGTIGLEIRNESSVPLSIAGDFNLTE